MRNKKKLRTSFYNAWVNMKQRCLNPNYTNFQRWGGRGITFDPRWARFINFYEDMYPTYKKGFSLDRIDNNGNYNKNNCRWTTKTKQANNMRSNRLLTYKNITHTLSDWSRASGIKRSTLAQRFYVYKWDIDRCLGG